MEQQDQYATESETIRLIAVEELKQKYELSFSAMLDLFYLNAFVSPKEDEQSGMGHSRADMSNKGQNGPQR
jgi:hypothetical protein